VSLNLRLYVSTKRAVHSLRIVLLKHDSDGLRHSSLLCSSVSSPKCPPEGLGGTSGDAGIGSVGMVGLLSVGGSCPLQSSDGADGC